MKRKKVEVVRAAKLSLDMFLVLHAKKSGSQTTKKGAKGYNRKTAKAELKKEVAR